MELTMKPCVLIVDDDSQICSMLKTMLELSGYPFLTARNGKEALSLFLSRKPEIVLLDLGLPDMDGVDIIQKSGSFRTLRFWFFQPGQKMRIRLKRWMPERTIIFPSRFQSMSCAQG